MLQPVRVTYGFSGVAPTFVVAIVVVAPFWTPLPQFAGAASVPRLVAPEQASFAGWAYANPESVKKNRNRYLNLIGDVFLLLEYFFILCY
jgi:hypothetical protein